MRDKIKWIHDCLRFTPADDVNFKSVLERASASMLTNALQELEARPKGNGSRITAILREQRRREKLARPQ
jgi:hypothetical protein